MYGRIVAASAAVTFGGLRRSGKYADYEQA
jgi:hypothetical protein